MDKYKKVLEGNQKVAMIQVSRDQDNDSAEAWAAKEGFPWLTVLPDDVERSGLLDYRPGNFVPAYTMVDKDGNKVVDGAEAVFQKAKEVGDKGGDA